MKVGVLKLHVLILIFFLVWAILEGPNSQKAAHAIKFRIQEAFKDVYIKKNSYYHKKMVKMRNFIAAKLSLN